MKLKGSNFQLKFISAFELNKRVLFAGWVLTNNPTSFKRPPIKRPPSIKRPLSKVPIYLSVNCGIWYLFNGHLYTRVFETRTATGSELFSLLTCPHTTTFTLLSIFSPLEMNSIKIWETIRSKNANCSLPVAVRVSKTRVLKLPIKRPRPPFAVTSALNYMFFLVTSIKLPANYLSKHCRIILNKSSVKYLEQIFFHILTVDAKRPKKNVLHFFCALSTRRNTVHFNYVPSVLELELWMGWECT